MERRAKLNISIYVFALQIGYEIVIALAAAAYATESILKAHGLLLGKGVLQAITITWGGYDASCPPFNHHSLFGMERHGLIQPFDKGIEFFLFLVTPISWHRLRQRIDEDDMPALFCYRHKTTQSGKRHEAHIWHHYC